MGYQEKLDDFFFVLAEELQLKGDNQTARESEVISQPKNQKANRKSLNYISALKEGFPSNKGGVTENGPSVKTLILMVQEKQGHARCVERREI